MRHVLLSIAPLLFMANGVIASNRVDQAASPRDVCNYKSRDWSAMREILEAVARYSGKNAYAVQEIAKQALAGSVKFGIGKFEMQYALHDSGKPPPNNAVCFVQRAKFDAINDSAADAEYMARCVATLDAKGQVRSISCEPIAG